MTGRRAASFLNCVAGAATGLRKKRAYTYIRLMANAATLRAGTAQGLVGEVDQGIHFNCAATHQRRGQHNYIADWITEKAGDHAALASDAKGSDRIGIYPSMAAAHGAWGRAMQMIKACLRG